MMSKKSISCAGLVAALALSVQTTKTNAQDVHFTQFTASPLIINPAFTGNARGAWRASAIYRDQWRSVTTPFKTYAISVDAPIVNDLTHDDYLAAGLQLYNDRAGDGNLSNLSALGSIAYHKFLGNPSDPNMALSVGFQGGYTQKSIDLSRLYFGNEFQDGQFVSGIGGENLNNKVDYFTFNAGISWAHNISRGFSYILGAGANNLNQPAETFQRKANSEVGLGMRYTGQVGAIAYVGENLSLRPALLYQSQSTATEIVVGNEFHYIIGNPEFQTFTTAVFVGGWTRLQDAIMITAGLEFKGMRLGLSYDINNSDLKNASNGAGGFEISLTYVAPNPLDFARKLIYPCARF